MKIAVTRLKGKEADDSARCSVFGHECYSVNPLQAVVAADQVEMFVRAVEKDEFDCIFFTSALPAKLIAPLLSHWPRVIAIGPQTAKTLRASGIGSEVLPAFYSRDFVPYLGGWIRGRRIGIPRADVPNPALLHAIEQAGGIATEFRCYSLEPTGITLELRTADAVLFTSAMSFSTAVWENRPGLIIMAIGDITAAAMAKGGTVPHVIGDGSLEGCLKALNEYENRHKGMKFAGTDRVPESD